MIDFYSIELTVNLAQFLAFCFLYCTISNIINLAAFSTVFKDCINAIKENEKAKEQEQESQECNSSSSRWNPIQE